MTLGAAIEQYISWKRSLGAGFDSQARILRSYGRSVGEETACDTATRAQARGFMDRGTPAASHRALKHGTLERFYRYAIVRGVASKSPLPTETPRSARNFRPYIYTSDEVRRLLDATETYRKHHRQLEPHTFRTLLLLLHGTGLRHGEALRLTLSDVDLPKRLLTVRATKFSKTRLVPPAPQLVPALERYAVRRRAAASAVGGDAGFFANRDGTPLVQVTVCGAYAKLRRAADVRREDGGRFQPRPAHAPDLRLDMKGSGMASVEHGQSALHCGDTFQGGGSSDLAGPARPGREQESLGVCPRGVPGVRIH